MINLLPRCGNLLQNPSFESDLAFWQADNVITTDSSPAEGTQAASLGPGVASLYQDVALGVWQRNPLFLSFIVYSPLLPGPSDFEAEVLWLDINGLVIGTGLRAFLPGSSISAVKNTFFDVTDRPPLNAVWARLKFSRDASGFPLLLDLVNLAPVETPNLVSNPSFELGLAEWDATNFSVVFTPTWEGGAAVQQSALPGTLSQDISLNPFRPGAAYLLSFAASSLQASTVTVQLIWLNVLGNPIGLGIDATVVPTTLSGQGKYLNIVQLSGPAPVGAVRARLLFTASGAVGSTLNLDQVILTRLASPNLLQNPGFASGLDGWTSLGVTAQGTGGYVGLNFAELSSAGAFINQTVNLPLGSVCRCFLLNFALYYNGSESFSGNVFGQVHWLDVFGNEIGLGLALVISQILTADQWLVYTGLTERVPLGAVSARIQFTKSAGSPETQIGLDSVIFARVD